MKIKEALKDWIEKMKEIQRLQYDYFKFLIPLSTGSIFILIAFIEKVLLDINTCEKVIIFLSLLAFLITIIFSLCTLPVIINMIMYLTGIQKSTIDDNITKEDEKEAYNLYGKFQEALDHVKNKNTVALISYIIGISFILITVLIRFINH